MTLTEIMASNPRVSIFLVAFLITFAMTLVTKYFTDQKRMKELKGMQKEHQKKIKENKGNFEEQKKIQQELMESSFEMMRHSFKPLIITFVPIIILFWWIKGFYSETSLANSWIWWYLGSAVLSSIFLRRALDVV